jgi:hypothetical protein
LRKKTKKKKEQEKLRKFKKIWATFIAGSLSADSWLISLCGATQQWPTATRPTIRPSS